MNESVNEWISKWCIGFTCHRTWEKMRKWVRVFGQISDLQQARMVRDGLNEWMNKWINEWTNETINV